MSDIKVKLLGIILQLEDGREITVKRPRGLASVGFDDIVEFAYQDQFGGIGINPKHGDFIFIEGKLPDNWKETDNDIKWHVTGPTEGTAPEVHAYDPKKKQPSIESIRKGEIEIGFLGSIICPDVGDKDGSYRLYIGSGVGYDHEVDHRRERDTYETLSKAKKALVRIITTHRNGGCKVCDGYQDDDQ